MPTEAHCRVYQREISELKNRQSMLIDVVTDISKNYRELKESHDVVKSQLESLIMKVENSRSFVAGVAATITTIGAAVGLFFTWWGSGSGKA